MTMWSGKLDGIDEEQFLAQLRMETDAKAVKRLTSALLYGQGRVTTKIPTPGSTSVATSSTWTWKGRMPTGRSRRPPPTTDRALPLARRPFVTPARYWIGGQSLDSSSSSR